MGSGYIAISMCTMTLQVLRQRLARRRYKSLLKISWNLVKSDSMKRTTTCLKLISRISVQQLGKNSIIGSYKSRRPKWKDRWGALQEPGLSIFHPYLGAILEGESPLSHAVHDCDAVQVLHLRRLKTSFINWSR